MDLQTELSRIVDALQAGRVDYALCGGIAVVVHGHPRLTRDIDILIRTEDLECVKRVVAPLGYSLESGLVPFDVGLPGERHVFRLTKAEGSDFFVLGLILVGQALIDAWKTREIHHVDGRELRIVSREGLAVMKRVAGRPKDLEDLRQLGLEPRPGS